MRKKMTIKKVKYYKAESQYRYRLCETCEEAAWYIAKWMVEEKHPFDLEEDKEKALIDRLTSFILSGNTA